MMCKGQDIPEFPNLNNVGCFIFINLNLFYSYDCISQSAIKEQNWKYELYYWSFIKLAYMYGPGSPTVSVSHGKDLEFCSSFIHKVGRSCSILTIVAWSIAGETLAFSISWTLKDFSGKDYRQHHGLDKLAHESKGE